MRWPVLQHVECNKRGTFCNHSSRPIASVIFFFFLVNPISFGTNVVVSFEISISSVLWLSRVREEISQL